VLAGQPLSSWPTLLAVDQTGVGRPVVDMLRPHLAGMIPVTITGGHTISEDLDGFRVPKKDLVGTLQVLLQSRRLRIASTLPEVETLVHELSHFKVKVNLSSGYESFESWRSRDHDDQVLATALAAWLGEYSAAQETSVEDAVQFTTYYTR
jgi:hypothetical protein